MKNLNIAASRCAAAKSAMNKDGIDVLTVIKDENKKYLSLFDSTSYTVVLTVEKNYIVTDFRYYEAATELEPLFTVIETSAEYGLIQFLREICKAGHRVGIEAYTVSMSFAEKLVTSLPDVDLKKSDGLIEELRAVKDETELENLKIAEKIGDEAFSYILNEIHPGVSEKQVALKLELKMRELGAEALSFDVICVSGARTSLPHGIPSDKQIEKGDFVTMDFGCKYNGYCSDMTRTVAVGHVSSEQRALYDLVLEAQLAACRGAHAGMKASEVDRLARDVIEAAGYGKFFGHGLGHGVGLEIHEAPTANTRSEEILKTGMMLTIEPGVYIPEKFGVRIEDLSSIDDSGIIILSKSEKDLIIL